MIAPHHAYAGMWDFSGACAPREDGTGHRMVQCARKVGAIRYERRVWVDVLPRAS